MPDKKLAADTNVERLTYSLPEFAERVGVSVRTIYASVERGEGPPLTKIGNRTVVRRQAGDAWLESREQASRRGPVIDLIYIDVIEEMVISIQQQVSDRDIVLKLGEVIDQCEEARGGVS